MKQVVKRRILLAGTLATVAGWNFLSDGNNVAEAKSQTVLCDWIDNPGTPVDGCKLPAAILPCACEYNC